MSRILVVYFSRSGNTRRIAKEIARECGADVEQVFERSGRGGLLGYLRSAGEAWFGIRAPIRPTRRKLKAYDMVIIGTPVWFWNIASPVRSYVLEHRDGLHRVAFFCTCGGSGGEKVLRDLQRLSGRPVVATLVLNERQLADPEHRAAVSKFVKSLGGGSARTMPAPVQV